VVTAVPLLDRVQAVHVLMPFRRPFEAAHGVFTERSSWIVRLRETDGREGFGEIAFDPAASRSDEAALARAVRQTVAMLAEGRESDWQRTIGGGSSPSGRAVLAGVDAAFEALSAQKAGAPGGGPISVSVNATLDFTGPSEAAEAAARAVASGFSTLKVKVVGEESVEALVERVKAIRESVGTLIRLRLDANCSWDFAMAVARLNALAKFDIEYVEQPLAADDLDGHAALRRECTIPIALDESVEDEASAARILAARSADVLVVKPARVGGPAVVRAIAARGAGQGVPLILSTFFETGVGAVAALRSAAALPIVGEERAHGLATSGMLLHDLLVTPLTVVDGRLALPAILAIDEDAIARYAVEVVGLVP
jgi:o-succinylbenzoate synthase